LQAAFGLRVGQIATTYDGINAIRLASATYIFGAYRMKSPRSSRSRPTEPQFSMDDDYYGTLGVPGPVSQPVPRQVQLDRREFFEVRQGPRQPPIVTKHMISRYDQLTATGVKFPSRGRGLAPPWHAHHPALPSDFEKPSASDKEDWERVLQLRRAGSEQAGKLEKLLAVPWEHLPKATLASSRYCRFMRVGLVAGFRAWFPEQNRGQLFHATLVSHLFFVPEGELNQPKWTAKRVKARFRQQLIDHGLSQCGGWMLAGLHATFERSPSGGHTGYQMHFHCIIDDAMKATVDSMTKSKPSKYYPKTEWIERPFRVERITSVAGITTYLAKSYWSNRTSAGAMRPEDIVVDGRRLGDTQQVEVLSWFDRQRFADLIFTYRCNLPQYVRTVGW
jgi:hypothetical protein